MTTGCRRFSVYRVDLRPSQQAVQKGPSMLTNVFTVIALLVSVVSGPLALSSCTNGTTRDTEHSKAAKPQPPVEVRLSFLGTPSPGTTLDVTMRVRSLIDAPLITMKWILPEGVASDGHPSLWTASMQSGEVRDFHASVRLPDAQRYVIEGIATIQQGDGTSYAGVDSLVIDLGAQQEKPRESTTGIVTRDLKGVREYRTP